MCIYIYVCVSVCVSVCLCVCVSVFVCVCVSFYVYVSVCENHARLGVKYLLSKTEGSKFSDIQCSEYTGS